MKEQTKSSVTVLSKRVRHFKGFGFHYCKVITDENDIIEGYNIYLFGKKALTIAISNTVWVDKQGEPYKCKIDGSVLFVHKLAIGWGKRGATE